MKRGKFFFSNIRIGTCLGFIWGYLKFGEHPREAPEWEIKEELGLVVSVDEELKIRTDRESARLDMCYAGGTCCRRFRSSTRCFGIWFLAEGKNFRFFVKNKFL